MKNNAGEARICSPKPSVNVALRDKRVADAGSLIQSSPLCHGARSFRDFLRETCCLWSWILSSLSNVTFANNNKICNIVEALMVSINNESKHFSLHRVVVYDNLN